MQSPVHRPKPPGHQPRPADRNRAGDASAQRVAPPVEWPDDPHWIQESHPLAPVEFEHVQREIAAAHRRLQREREPRPTPPPPLPAARRHGWPLFITVAGTTLFAGLAGYYVLERVTVAQDWTNAAADKLVQLASLEKVPPEPPPGSPRLIVDGATASAGEEILVGALVDGPAEGAMAIISGLAPGTTLTIGRPWGTTGWIVPAESLHEVLIRPPDRFVGTMDFTIALRNDQNALIDRKSIRLEWASRAVSPSVGRNANEPDAAPATPPAQSASGTTRTEQESEQPASAAQTPAIARSLSEEEIARLLKRGEQFFQAGDVAGARLLFRRAAEARHAGAAFALASTYDPAVLEKLGVFGASADLAKARAWYERARDYGSKEAPQRLELLASQSR